VSGPAQTRMEGRFEKRLPAEIPVRILAIDFRNVLEWTVTVNVSPGGARVKSRLPWRQNDQLGVASLASGFNLRAKVVYCEPQAAGDFQLGLDFRPVAVDWELFARG
jgi:PilZ domain-containing protein